MSLPVTYETFDLEPMTTVRSIERRAAQSPGGLSPQFSRRRTARVVRRYVYPVLAGRAERRRLNDIWNRTRFGTLPMTLVHPEDGTLAVVFDTDTLDVSIDTAEQSLIEIPLREWVS